jgi:hypothetical protein
MKNSTAEQFANHESIKRLKKQLESATDETQRTTLFAWLAEENAKAEQLANESDPAPDDKGESN